MEFTVNCPTDGHVEVSLEDVSRVVLRDADRVEIVFSCPICGSEVPLTLRVPNLLMAAVESADEEIEKPKSRATSIPIGAVEEPAQQIDAEEDRRVRAYCEYFRRQLSRINCVEDMLHEIDG